MMAGTPAAIWEHEMILRMDPCAEDGGTKNVDMSHWPQLSVSEFLLRDGELTFIFV